MAFSNRHLFVIYVFVAVMMKWAEATSGKQVSVFLKQPVQFVSTCRATGSGNGRHSGSYRTSHLTGEVLRVVVLRSVSSVSFLFRVFSCLGGMEVKPSASGDISSVCICIATGFRLHGKGNICMRRIRNYRVYAVMHVLLSSLLFRLDFAAISA
eukprot:m.11332 g.11332  ORF g.11332 m.11332 type:complete len:154 (+) comp23175_c0_seq2:217-678(+)